MLVETSRRAHSLLPVLAAGLILLGACTTNSTGQEVRSGEWAEPTESQVGGPALPPPGTEEGAGAEGLPEVPSQAVPSESAEGEAAEGEEGIIFKGPDGTTWTVTKKTDEEAYRADIEDCYNYAVAQTRRDRQITDDRNAGINTLTSESRYSILRQRVDEYDLRNRRGALLTECMEAKGYARTDTVLPRVVF